MPRECNVCKLKRTHPKAYKKLTHELNNPGKLSMTKFIEQLNKDFNLKLNKMNVSRHKTHMEGNSHELKKKASKVKREDPSQIEMEVYSETGELLYTNIQEIIDSLRLSQKTFCEAFVNTYNHNATAAYQFAFNCENYRSAAAQASALLKNLNVILYINFLTEERSKRLKISSSFVLTGLMENYARCMQAEPILDREGTPIGIYTYNPNAANKALELIGKHLQMWDKDPKVPTNPQFYESLIERLVEKRISPVQALLEMGKEKMPYQDLVKILLTKSDLTQLTDGPKREGDDLKKADTNELEERLKLIEMKKQKLQA